MRFHLFLLSLFAVSAAAQTPLTKEQLLSLRKPHGIWTADWSPASDLIALGGDDSLLRIYSGSSLNTTKAWRMPHMVRCARWDNAGRRLAVTLYRGAYILDVTTGSAIELKGLADGSRAITWSPTNDRLAAIDNDIKIFTAAGRHVETILKEDRKTGFAISWHPTEDLLVVGGDDIRIVDIKTKSTTIIKHRKDNIGVLTVAWHPSGDFFATGDYGHYGEGMPSLIQLWDRNGRKIREVSAGKLEYRTIRWIDDGKWLLTSGDAVRQWDTSLNLVATGPEQTSIWGLCKDNKSRRIFSATFGGEVLVLDDQLKTVLKVW